ncbi:pyridoxamine 5'-phosphate oxidase family protein [bacterium]|nr:pyridoxamine 5'-phosphate oxidase family protein [bacterium]RQV94281.1 MAG: pyridoxamine 5'-phosphate oxidase family protein [bacterium]
MRKQNQGITDRNVIEGILSESEICRMAIMDNGKPYIVPLNYGYKNNAIYMHSAPAGKKIELLRKNNQVCFEIEHKVKIIKSDDPCKWSTMYRSVVGYGDVEIITDHEQKKMGLDIIMAHHGKHGGNQYEERLMDLLVILKLNITEMTGKQSEHWIED